MARVVGAQSGDIRALGAAMGLGRPPRITREQQRRSYITVIRRNWHLLPYEQLLALLGWSAEELAYTLREDDFLWVKLGSLKPKCAPVRWSASTMAGDLATATSRLARWVKEEFARPPADTEVPTFGFLGDLEKRPGRNVTQRRASTSGAIRYCYSYAALYGDPLLEPDLDPYPDGYLARLAESGVSGVWMQAVLYRLAEFPWQPDLSARWQERLGNLRRLSERVRRHGLRIFLYLNEPRAMPLAFFQGPGRADLQGVIEGDHAALCTSHPEVQRYLRGAVEGIVRAVPGLGGFFTITASENFTNCWSHGQGKGCRRCSGRSPAEVIAEVNATIQRGIEAGVGTPADPGAPATPRLLAWDWGWQDAWAPEVIERLPAAVGLMSVSEWSLPLERGGVKTTVGEYSISAVGPGPRATKHWELAHRRGLRTFAKIQANNTWELSALPYLPTLANVALHASRLRERNLDGVMLGWTLGGYPSPNLEAVAEIMEGGTLASVAERRFGATLAPIVLRAWEAFSVAFREFPYDGSVVYQAPLQMGPANLLWSNPTGYHSTMVGLPYDHLAGWRGPYPVEIFIAQMEKVAQGFSAAAEVLREAIRSGGTGAVDPRHAVAGLAEADLGLAAALHFQSVANQSRFVRARDAGSEAPVGSAGRAGAAGELERLLRDELRLAKELHRLQGRDSRLGFEATNHYYYVPVDLAEKVVNCRHLLEDWLPGWRGGNP